MKFNPLIVYPLVILGIVAILIQSVAVSGYTFDDSGFTVENFTAELNGTDYTVEGQTLTFGIDDEYGVMAGIFGLFVFVGLIGVTAVTVGLNSESVRFIGKGSAFLGIWTLFSSLALEGLNQLDLLGWLFYIVLTLAYLIGILMEW